MANSAELRQLKELIEKLTRYDLDFSRDFFPGEDGCYCDADMTPSTHGEWLSRDAVLALFKEGS